MWNLEYDIYTNELVDKAEIGLQTQKTDLWLPKGKVGGGQTRSLGLTDRNCFLWNRSTTGSTI